MNRREALIKMAEGHKITHPFWDKGCYKFFKTDGLMMSFEPNGTGVPSVSNGGLFESEQFEIFEKRIKYWLWYNPDTGCVTKYFYDDHKRDPAGQLLNDCFTKKLEWSEVEF